MNRHAAVHEMMAHGVLMMLLMLVLVLWMERRSHLLLFMVVHHVLHHWLRESANVNVDALLETVQTRQMLFCRRWLTRSWRATRKDVEVATFSHKGKRRLDLKWN